MTSNAEAEFRWRFAGCTFSVSPDIDHPEDWCVWADWGDGGCAVASGIGERSVAEIVAATLAQYVRPGPDRRALDQRAARVSGRRQQ